MLEKRLPVPAYDMLLKCSHAFNVLDARGAVGVTERADCFARMRALAREVTGVWLCLNCCRWRHALHSSLHPLLCFCSLGSDLWMIRHEELGQTRDTCNLCCASGCTLCPHIHTHRPIVPCLQACGWLGVRSWGTLRDT
jgi:hypothetical protein